MNSDRGIKLSSFETPFRLRLELGGGAVANLGPRWGLWVDADYTQDIDGEEREVVRGTARAVVRKRSRN